MAFAVSGAFVFAGHLAFTVSFNSDYLVPVIIGKLTAGICSVILANFVFNKMNKNIKAEVPTKQEEPVKKDEKTDMKNLENTEKPPIRFSKNKL